MAKKESSPEGMSMPIIGMLVIGLLSAVVVAAQVELIKYWPQPATTAAVFGGDVGFWWGLLVGAPVGLLIGFIADEKNYPDQKQY